MILYNWEKSILPCERTAEEVSNEWSHERTSSTDSKVGASNNTEKYHSGAFLILTPC